MSDTEEDVKSVVSRLTRERGTQRAQATKLQNQTNLLVNTQTTQKPDLQQIKRNIVQLQQKIEKIQEYDADILSYIEKDEDYYKASDDAETQLQKIIDRKLFYEQYIDEKTNPQPPNHHVTPSSEGQTPQRANLPKLALPKFSGDILNWLSFWDSFSAVVDNSKIPIIQKYQYLKSLLTGPALACVEGLTLTEANYSQAIDILNSRFGQKHLVKDAHMQAIMAEPAPQYSYISLRKFRDVIEGHIRSLESLHGGTLTSNDMLVSIIWNKFPSELRSNIVRFNGNRQFYLPEIRKFLINELEVLDASVQGSKSSLESSAVTLLATNSNQASVPPVVSKSCSYCKSKCHFTNECNQFISRDQRVAFIQSKSLCYNCLGPHRVSDCNSKFSCKLCKRRHHTSICPGSTNNGTQKVSDPTPSQSRAQPIPKPRNNSRHNHSKQMITNVSNVVLLKTAVVKIFDVCNSNSTLANLVLDDGAQRSFASQSIVNLLGLKSIRREIVDLSGFGAEFVECRALDVVRISIQCLGHSNFVTVDLIVVPTISSPLMVPSLDDVRNCPNFAGLEFANHPCQTGGNFEIQILIGADQYYNLVEGELIRGPSESDPIAVKTKVGYVLSGPVSDSSAPHHGSSVASMLTVVRNHSQSDLELKNFWENKSENSPINPDLEFMHRYNSTIERDDEGRYIAPFPWKDNFGTLPSNFGVCAARTRATARRLAKDPRLFKLYSDLILDQKSRDFIERVPPDEIDNRSSHYIPHHPVFRESATTPVRIVYDCSCRECSNSSSLNDCLEPGPALQHCITSILIRFRLYGYAAISDLEKAFLQIRLADTDKDYARFLWLSDPTDPESSFVHWRFRVILFGSSSSPFILNTTVLKHLTQYHSNVANLMLKNVYVDNFGVSLATTDQMDQYFHESREIMSDAKFNLRSWATNCDSTHELAKCENVLDESEVVKFLGLFWNVISDHLSFSSKLKITSNFATKREMLSDASKVYDPLGLIAPIIIRARIFMQYLWSLGTEWDEPLNAAIMDSWLPIIRELQRAVDLIHVKRCPVSAADAGAIQLHVFSDASSKALGACAYLCFPLLLTSYLVLAKSKVAPIKPVSIPRLELNACVVASQLAKQVVDSSELDLEVFIWSDSLVALGWINSTKSLPVYVQNRVKIIKSQMPNCQWLFVPSRDNPSDILSRGCDVTTLANCKLWWEGPDWLAHRGEWPEKPGSNIPENGCSTLFVADSQVQSHSESEHNPVIVDVNRYSSLWTVKRVMAYVLRFIECLKLGIVIQSVLTSSELRNAELMLAKQTQAVHFGTIIKRIMSGKSTKSIPLVSQLRLFLDNDKVLRSAGRIHNADLSPETRFPALLPSDNQFTKLVVWKSHERAKHMGVAQTVTTLRQNYWVPHARQVVKSIIKTCVICKKVIGKSYMAPNSPPLPSLLVQEARPFLICGVDFTGAILVKDQPGKSYICLFTCAVTRAVHLEVVPDLTVETFLHAFRRFSSRRGCPQKMMSDNASTYESAAAIIKELLSNPHLTHELSKEGVEWSFVPRRAPWMAGYWERLVGIVKTCLKKVLGRALVNSTELVTIVTEIEGVVNDRPLTYVSSDSGDPEPLTPAHLLNGRRIRNLPHVEIDSDYLTDPDFLTHENVTSRMKHASCVFQNLWHRWRSEYLTSLRERYTKSGSNNIKVHKGDLVHIHDDTPRVRWKLGVITDLNYGRDGLPRSAILRTANGVTNRPIAKLIPLEINCEISEPQLPDTNNQNINANQVPVQRVRRKAAQDALERIRYMYDTSCAPEDDSVDSD